MKTDSKGFTLVEVFVSLLVMAVIILIGFSFFIYQGQRSGSVAKEMASDEAISLTLMLIKRDILHVQYGLSNKPELAVFVMGEKVAADGGRSYSELYVNYGRILSGHFQANVPNNVFQDSAYKTQAQVSGGQFTVQLPMVQTPTTPDLDAQAQALQQEFIAHIGAAIIAPNPFTSPTNIVTRDLAGAATGGAGARACQFTLTGGSPGLGTFNLSPATVYRWAQVADPRTGELYGVITRNGRNLLGGNPALTVQDFRIRCAFIDPAGVNLLWTPESTRKFNDMRVDNLRLIEVTIRYRHLDLASATRREQTLEIGKGARPGPRLTVLNTYY